MYHPAEQLLRDAGWTIDTYVDFPGYTHFRAVHKETGKRYVIRYPYREFFLSAMRDYWYIDCLWGTVFAEGLQENPHYQCHIPTPVDIPVWKWEEKCI